MTRERQRRYSKGREALDMEVRRMGWVESGRAWGARAADWACLVEPYARSANDALFDRTGVGPGTELLDIACGSGYAASVAARRGLRCRGWMPLRSCSQ